MRKKVLTYLVALLTVLGLGLSISGCGSSSNPAPVANSVGDADGGNFDGGVTGSIEPVARGPVVNNEAYCAYVTDKQECADSNIPPDHWYAMPDQQPQTYRADSDNTSDLLAAMFMWHLLYSPYYGGYGYYNAYIPASRYGGYSNYQTTVVNNFNTSNKTNITNVQNKAQWKDGTGKPVPAKSVTPDKMAPTKAQAAAKQAASAAKQPAASTPGPQNAPPSDKKVSTPGPQKAPPSEKKAPTVPKTTPKSRTGK